MLWMVLLSSKDAFRRMTGDSLGFLPLCVALAPALAYQLVGEDDASQGISHRRHVGPLSEITELLTSDVLTRIRKPLVFLNMISAAIFAFNFYILPPGQPAHHVAPLQQRLKTANERFIRGRCAWSEIVNVTRNLNRQAHLWASRESFLVFARWLPAFPAALLWDLRSLEEDELATILKSSRGSNQDALGGLTDLEVDQVLTRPPGKTAAFYVLQKLQVVASKLHIPDPQGSMMQQALSKLSEAAEACEKEKQQVILPVYQYSAGLLFLWLSLLPFILPSQLQVGVVLAQQVLAFGLLGIEDVTIQLEEPFTVLPMEGPCASLANECQAVRANWRRMRKGLETPKAKETPKKYPLAFPRDDRIFPCYPDEMEAGKDDEVILLK
eukprot:symbB.v1.2.005516.t1/scaffold310.1/size231343/21